MNTNQYTQKTLEALQAAQQLAVEYQHNALEPEHLLHALATQEQGLIPQLLQKLNVDAGSFSAAVAEKLSAMPRVSGSGRDPDKVYISQATDKVLSAAAREAKAMKDDYVSVEHVFLALLDEQTQNTSELFRAFSITKDKFLQQLTAVRGKEIGMIFQGFNLIANLNAIENVELPLIYRGTDKKTRHQLAVDSLKLVGLEKRMDHKPSEMSGGQQQRVAIARAIAAQPPVILADEPTGNLDSASSREILAILKKMHKSGRTVILITHDNGIAAQARRVVRIMDGKIESDTINEDFDQEAEA